MKSILLFMLSSAAVMAQTVQGDVFDSITGAPIAGAYVSIYGVQSIITRTDPAGHFSLQLTQPNQSVTVTRVGYLQSQQPLRQPNGSNSAARITLTPASVISGRVEDEDGFPVANAQVQALRYQVVNGERKLQAQGLGGSPQTNDLGEYRIANLAAGRYYIAFSPGNLTNWDPRYLVQYWGGSLQPDEDKMVEVKTGQELTGLDMRLAKFEGVTISGRIELPAGLSAAQRPMINLQPKGPLYGSFAMATLPGDGTFVIHHVPPGAYTLQVRPPSNPGTAGQLAAEQPVVVAAADITGIVLTPHVIQAVDLTGTFALAHGGTPSAMMINLRPMSGNSMTARADEDGSFAFKGLLPGHYDIQVTADYRTLLTNASAHSTPDPAAMAQPTSARLGEQEVLQKGFDIDGAAAPPPLRITLSIPIMVTGKLLNAMGQPVPGTTLFFKGGQPRNLAVTMTGTDGSFRVGFPLPDDYHVAMAADQSSLTDPDYVKAHENDFPIIHIVDGQNPSIILVQPVVK